MSSRYIAPNKTASTSFEGGGIYIGTVTSTLGGKVFVEIPAVIQDFSFGPCLKTIVLPAVGSKVICAFVGHELDEVLVIGKIQ